MTLEEEIALRQLLQQEQQPTLNPTGIPERVNMQPVGQLADYIGYQLLSPQGAVADIGSRLMRPENWLADTAMEVLPTGGFAKGSLRARDAWNKGNYLDFLTETGNALMSAVPGGGLSDDIARDLVAPFMGITIPRLTGNKFAWEYKDVLPDVKRARGAVKMSEKLSESPMITNDVASTIAARHNAGELSLDEAQPLFMQSLNKNEEGRTVFDDVRLNAEKMRQYPSENWKDYKEIKMSIHQGSGNTKVEGKAGTGEKEYIPLDTSRGCLNNCNECYQSALCRGTVKKNFSKPKKVELTGDFFDNPGPIRRVGTGGEPSWNPITEDYDWSWTNQQLINTNLASPEGQKKTFVITKLNTINGFDPSVIRNLEVSVDPFNPDHFFQSLKNVRQLKAIDPDLNIAMRIRSVSTMSDEINSLQKIAVDFANQNQIPVLETRMRFKSKAGLETAFPNPDYYWANQFKEASYKPESREVVPETSALSKFGLEDGLHYVCNETNQDCSTCQLCRKFLKNAFGIKR